jgi:hypothetical protein
MAAYLSATVYDPWSKNERGTIHPFSLWNKSTSRRMNDKVVFEPFLIKPKERDIMDPNNEEDNLNLFTGMMHQYDPEFEVEMKFVKPWIDFLFNVWCKQSPKLYFFILNFLSDIFLNPNEKPGLGFLIKGKQGSGKGTFINDFFSVYVVGKNYSVTTTTMDQLVGRFNSITSNKLLIVGDELGEGGSIYKVADKMKSLTSDSLQSIEKKFQEPIVVNTPCRPIFLTNHPFGTIRVELNCRRYPCYDTSSRLLNNLGFFKELRKNLTMENGLHFFHFLIQRRGSWKKWQKNKIPMTALRFSLMKHSLPPSLKFIVHQITTGEWLNLGVPQSMGAGQFQSLVDDFYAENISKKGKVNYSITGDSYMENFITLDPGNDTIIFKQYVSPQESTEEFNTISEMFREMQESYGIGNNFMELEEVDEYLEAPMDPPLTEEEELIEMELRKKEIKEIRNLNGEESESESENEENEENESENEENESENESENDNESQKRKREDSESDSESEVKKNVKKKRNIIISSDEEEEEGEEKEEESGEESEGDEDESDG